MNSYAERHAELYDLLYADKPYTQEASFVASLVRTHAERDRPVRRILDVACGTGGHALALQSLGFEVYGIDASEPMLTIARRKTDALGIPLRVERQDMRALHLGAEQGCPFDAAICLFDSIGHATKDEGVAATLAGMRSHLTPGGTAVLEFWHGPAFVQHFERCRVRRLVIPGADVLRISETEVDLVRQTATVRYEFHELRSDGAHRMESETVPVRFFGVAEMAGFLQRAGLEPVAFHDGYSSSTTISAESIHVVAIARRR